MARPREFDEERGPVRLQDLVITLFARDVLDGSPSLQPVPLGKLAALQQVLFTASGPGCDEPTFREEIPGRFHAAFAAWVARLEVRARVLAQPQRERSPRHLPAHRLAR